MLRHPVIHSVLDVKTSCHSQCPWCQDTLSFTVSLMSRHPVIYSVLDFKTSCHSQCPWCLDPVIQNVLDVKTSCHSQCPWCLDPVVHSVPDVLIQSFTMSLMSFTVSLMSVFWCRGKGKVDGVQTDDDEIRSDLETIQPALIDTQARRIRRREKLFLALKGFGTCMFAISHFVVSAHPCQHRQWKWLNYGFLVFFSDQLTSETFVQKSVSPSF